MLLMRLESKEKFSFLQLAHYIARIDKRFGEKEEEIIKEYCDEMGIENLSSFDMENFSLDDILNDFKSKKSQKIVLLEIMILIHIDNDFDLNEQELIKKMSAKFDISLEDAGDFSQWGKSVAMLYEVAKMFINEEKEMK